MVKLVINVTVSDQSAMQRIIDIIKVNKYTATVLGVHKLIGGLRVDFNGGYRV